MDSNKNPSDLLHNDEKEIFFMCTSQDLTGVWKDRMDTYGFGDEHCYFFAPWIGPQAQERGRRAGHCAGERAGQELQSETFFNTPPSSWYMRTAR